MKITICGSIAFQNEILSLKEKLEEMGHEIGIWSFEVKDKNGKFISVQEYYKIRQKVRGGVDDNQEWVWNRKAEAIMEHFNKIVWSDVILVANYDKKDIKGYVGGNSLMEMGVAFFLKKKIYLLNEIPEISYKEEILGMKPIILNGDLNKIK